MKNICVGQICESVSKTFNKQQDSVILINTSDVLDGKILNYKEEPNLNLKGQFKKTFETDDILYSEIRPSNRRFAYVSEKNTEKYVASTKLMVIRAFKEFVDPKYLYLYLTSSEIVNKLQHLAETRSGTFPQITFSEEIAKLVINLPPIPIQKDIVNFINSIDNKINVNNQINKNLEAQARMLYRAWFIDFSNSNGEMPNSWKIGKLKDILKLNRKSTKAGELQNLPYLPIDIIPMNTFALSSFKSNEEAQSSLITFDENDIIIGAMRVYFHRVILAPCSGITRTTCFTLTPYDSEYLSFCLLCCDQDSTINYAQKTSKGSTMPYAVWDGGLGDMDIVIPDKKIIQDFNKLVMPMLEKIKSSYFENYYLNNLRDKLLPKLLLGDLDVSSIK